MKVKWRLFSDDDPNRRLELLSQNVRKPSLLKTPHASHRVDTEKCRLDLRCAVTTLSMTAWNDLSEAGLPQGSVAGLRETCLYLCSIAYTPLLLHDVMRLYAMSVLYLTFVHGCFDFADVKSS